MHKESIRYEELARAVYQHDFDRYLSALSFPAELRPAVHVLTAFNLEIARIHELTHEPLIGHMRLAWWREALDEMYSGKAARRHPLAEALNDVIGQYRLSHAHFDALLNARSSDFDEAPFEDVQALEEYAAGSAAALFFLWEEVGGGKGGVESLRHLGIAWGLAGMLRGAVSSPMLEKRVFPESLRKAHKAQGAGLNHGSENVKSMVRTVIATAKDHLQWYDEDPLDYFHGARTILHYRVRQLLKSKGDIRLGRKASKIQLVARLLLS